MSGHHVAQLVSNERAHLDRLLQLVREDPADPEAQFFFAAWLARQGNFEEALEVLNKLTRRHANHPGIWLFKATVLEQMGDTKKAQACRTRAEQFLHPDDAPPPSPAQVIAQLGKAEEEKPPEPVRPVPKGKKRRVAIRAG